MEHHIKIYTDLVHFVNFQFFPHFFHSDKINNKLLELIYAYLLIKNILYYGSN